MQLRKLARHVGDIIRAFPTLTPESARQIERILHRYAETIEPWAETVAQRMLNDVSIRDQKAWEEYTRQMGRALAQEIRSAPTGAIMQRLLAEQVTLIKSLPIEAAQRVHKITTEYIATGQRADELAKQIIASGEVTKARANLIARTETSRTALALTQARAEHIGSEGYIWRTSLDKDVRPIHKKLEGTFHRWDDPPIAGESGERGHPGGIYNCRCYPEVVIPDKFD